MNFHHILHIDDDEDDQEILQTALNRISGDIAYTPMTDAETALHSLQTGAIHPDLIFLDLNMPRMDGRQFLKDLNSGNSMRPIPVIILSTASHIAARDEMMKLGATDFKTKPADFGEWVDLLNTILKS